jgi:hypothetical protein
MALSLVIGFVLVGRLVSSILFISRSRAKEQVSHAEEDVSIQEALRKRTLL